VRLEAQRDDKGTQAVLIIVGVLSAIAMGFLLFAPAKNSELIFMSACAAAPLLAIFFRFASMSKNPASAKPVTSLAGGCALGLFATLGAFILVFVVCAGRIIATID
jgi:hypothetical protein